MSTAAPLLPAGSSDRLQAYTQLLAVIAEQTTALEQGDGARLWELAEQRRRLEEELDTGDDGGEPPTPLHRELLLLVEQSREALEERLRTRDELRDFWIRMREEALCSARTVRIHARSPGQYRDQPSYEVRLDVRL